MNKTLFLGDIHGRNIWKDIVAKENPDRVVFIGDYFDSFDKSLTAAIQMQNFQDIIDFKKAIDNGFKTKEVIILTGNHDYHYYPGGETYSGYQYGAAPAIRQLLEENKHHLQMCYQIDNILCSHAGIGYDWLINQCGYKEGNIADFVNDIWQHQPTRFVFMGFDQYGDSKTQTPIWIRPRSLMSGNHDTFLKKEYIQVVGHTAVKTIDMGVATGSKYYFIDTFDVNSEYITYENQTFNKQKL